MKKIILFLPFIILFTNCKQTLPEKQFHLRDGFYQVNNKDTDSTNFGTLSINEVMVNYNSIYNEQGFTKLVIDTSDFVPLELEKIPVTQKDSSQKMQLSITLSAEAAEKLKIFTAQRIMKGVAIVLDGEAITMHKIKDTITGGKMVISWCGENACQQLFTKIKNNVKK